MIIASRNAAEEEKDKKTYNRGIRERNGWIGKREIRRNRLCSKEEGVKRAIAGQTEQENRNHNVILTEITPPHLPRDNKFATLSRILE